MGRALEYWPPRATYRLPARRLLAAVLGLLWLSVAATAFAAPPDEESATLPRAQARKVTRLVEEAQRLREAGELGEAIAKLEEALAIYPAAALYYNLARTLEDDGQLARARDNYRLCLDKEPSERVRERAETGLARVEEQLAAAQPPTTSRPGWFHLGFSVGEGFVGYGGSVWRSHVSLELVPSARFGWFGLELGATVFVEPPVAVLFRPGARFQFGIPYLRLSFPFLVTPALTTGAMLGVGGDFRVSGSWRIFLEADTTLWFEAISVVLVEGRVGFSYGF